MCVIVYKPAGIKIKESTLKKMWDANKDGAGLAYFNEDVSITIEKGFMTLEDLSDALEPLTDKTIALHFRLATHGKVNPHQTHPFAVSTNVVDSKAYFSNKTFKSVIFHNGIIDEFGTKKISDTLHFVSNVLARIPDTATRLKLLGITDSKYILMENGYFYNIGKFEKFEGLEVSNTYFDVIYPTGGRRFVYEYSVSDTDYNDEKSLQNLYREINEGKVKDVISEEEKEYYGCESLLGNSYVPSNHDKEADQLESDFDDMVDSQFSEFGHYWNKKPL